MSTLGTSGWPRSGYSPAGGKDGRRRSASARPVSGGRRPYIASIAFSVSQTIAPSSFLGGKGKFFRNVVGAPAGGGNGPNLGQRCTSRDARLPFATRAA